MTARALLSVTAALVSLCAACGSTPAPTVDTPPTTSIAAAACGNPNGSAASSFASLRDATVKPICLDQVGPGLGGSEIAERFADVAAGEITDDTTTIGTNPPGLTVLRVLSGQLASGTGEQFVDALLGRLGPDAANGTVDLSGHRVHHIAIPGGPMGYAFGQGRTVVIGYLAAPGPGVRPEWVELPGTEAFHRILNAATGTPTDPTVPPGSPDDTYPLGSGRYTTPGDVGWVYFLTEAGQSCGIGPNGAVAGCDNVPADAPGGTNQTVVRVGSLAEYIASDTTTFTRDVDILPAGHRLDNGDATCSVGYQGTVHCTIGDHGFVIASQYGVLE